MRYRPGATSLVCPVVVPGCIVTVATGWPAHGAEIAITTPLGGAGCARSTKSWVVPPAAMGSGSSRTAVIAGAAAAAGGRYYMLDEDGQYMTDENGNNLTVGMQDE